MKILNWVNHQEDLETFEKQEHLWIGSSFFQTQILSDGQVKGVRVVFF